MCFPDDGKIRICLDAEYANRDTDEVLEICDFQDEAEEFADNWATRQAEKMVAKSDPDFEAVKRIYRRQLCYYNFDKAPKSEHLALPSKAFWCRVLSVPRLESYTRLTRKKVLPRGREELPTISASWRFSRSLQKAWTDFSRAMIFLFSAGLTARTEMCSKFPPAATRPESRGESFPPAALPARIQFP